MYFQPKTFADLHFTRATSSRESAEGDDDDDDGKRSAKSDPATAETPPNLEKEGALHLDSSDDEEKQNIGHDRMPVDSRDIDNLSPPLADVIEVNTTFTIYVEVANRREL